MGFGVGSSFAVASRSGVVRGGAAKALRYGSYRRDMEEARRLATSYSETKCPAPSCSCCCSAM